MADWQERVQSMIMGFVFAYMVMKLFSVIANFRAGNMRVERVSSEDEGGAAMLASTSEAEVETETEAEAEQEPREHSSSSSSDDDEEVDAAVVQSKDVAEGEVKPEEKKDITTVVEPALKVESEEETGGGAVKEETVGGAFEEETVGGAFEEEAEEDGDDDDEKDLEDWEGVESTELEKRFGAASTFADTMTVNPEATLQLHALYKIATEGPCSSSQPSAFQPTARAKWNAWQKLGSMSQEEAMQKYIELVTAINPNWCEDYRKRKDLAKEATQQKQADVSTPSGGQTEAMEQA